VILPVNLILFILIPGRKGKWESDLRKKFTGQDNFPALKVCIVPDKNVSHDGRQDPLL